MNKKKLLIFHHSNVIGGAGLSLLDILLVINKELFDITLYIPRGSNDLYNELKKININIKFYQFEIPIIEHFSGLFHFFFSRRSLANIISIIRSRKKIIDIYSLEKPNLIILNSMTLSYIGYYLSVFKINIICFHRETFVKGLFGFRTSLIKYFLSNYFSVIVFISKYDFQKVYPKKAKKIIIYDKVHLERYNQKYERNNDEFLILFTGGMQRIKGGLVILKALTLLPNNFKLLYLQYDNKLLDFSKMPKFYSLKEYIKYIFSIGYNYKIFKFIQSNNLSSRIYFFDSQNDVSKFFNQCDLVVFPSTSPHQARPLYEAGAAHKPILITKSKNIEEFFTNGFNGYWFKNKDHKTLAERILSLSKDSNLREKLGRTNFMLTLKNHDFKNLESEIAEILGYDFENKS